MNALETLFLVVFWAWFLTGAFFLRQTILPRLPIFRTPDQLGCPYESVKFQASDGVRLAAWLIRANPERPWIIVCHGLGANRADILDIAAGLYRADFNLLLMDFRAHGESGGRMSSFGWREQRDLEGALAFLGQQPDIPARPYGFYGISMGGSVGLVVAARDERLGAVAADSPFTDLRTSIYQHLKLMFPWLPRMPFGWFCEVTYRLWFGAWPAQFSPLAAAPALGPRPLLLIQGEADPRMSVEGAKLIFSRASEPKELWIIPGAAHLEGHSRDPKAYLDRLTDFFDKSLRPAPAR